jgi:hypothetical protein
MVNRVTAEELCFLCVITVNQAREFIGLEPLIEAGDFTGTRDIGAGDRIINLCIARLLMPLWNPIFTNLIQRVEAGDYPK